MSSRDDRRRVVVTGVGIVTPGGRSIAELHAAALAGRAPGARRADLTLDGMVAPIAEPFDDFDARAELGRQGLRALDRTGRLTAVAAQRALADSGWTTESLASSEVGLILGTMFGSVRTIAGFDRRGVTAGPSYAKPLEFANSVINAAAGQTAIRFDLRGLNATVSGDLTAGLQALAYAADAIRGGRVDAALAGGADELCIETLYGFHNLGLLCDPAIDRSVPLDRAKTGMVLSEAAALVMLESLEGARQRGANILGEIHGHGCAYDPIADPADEPDAWADTVADAVRQALAESDVEAAAIDCVSLGANGTHLDAIEAGGIDEALEAGEPVTAIATKASTGETLGASGALQLALTFEGMRAGTSPGIPGLRTSEPAGRLHVNSQPSAAPGRTALLTAVGLQGKATALVAERAA